MVQVLPDVRTETGGSPRRTALRLDIQALRAVAVTLVVFNHLWPHRITGGYVGVDIFFVISGFLITKHLLSEIEQKGRVRLGLFYGRRAKRLLPAAMLVAVVSMAATAIFLPYSRWVTISQETMAAVLYMENWLLAAKSVDYSAHSDAASTVQHYWSLSVEEQFYIVWPLILLGLYFVARRAGKASSRRFGVGIAGIFGVGLVVSVLVTASHPNEAYFVTPTRAWEFAIGGFVAWLSARSLVSGRSLLPRHDGFRDVLQWLGYVMIAVSALTFNADTPFPGYYALLPTVGTALIIWVGPSYGRWTPNSLLSVRPVQVLGDVSYSVYLWHWPLIIILPAMLGRELSLPDKGMVLVLTIALSIATKKLVEDPGRQKLFRLARPRRVLFATACAMVVCVVLSGTLWTGAKAARGVEEQRLQSLASGTCFGAESMNPANSCEQPFGPPQAANIGPDEAPWFDVPECVIGDELIPGPKAPTLRRCDFASNPDTAKDVWLIGDSHAEQWQVAVHKVAVDDNWNLTKALLGGCPIVDVNRVAFKGSPTTDGQRCMDWSKEVSDRLLTEMPQAVIISGFALGETIDDGSDRSQIDQYRDAVKKRVGEWAAKGIEVYFIRDTPLTLDKSTPVCVAAHEQAPFECATDRAAALPPDPLAEAGKSLKMPNVHVIDLSDRFCDDSHCYAVIGGLHVYFDNDHMARSYAETTARVLEQRLNAAGS